MALMTSDERAKVWAYIMRLGAGATVPNCLKADIREAVDATDAWIDAAGTSYNNALPVAFRNNASLVQKTLLLCYVAMRRAGVLRVEEDVE